MKNYSRKRRSSSFSRNRGFSSRNYITVSRGGTRL